MALVLDNLDFAYRHEVVLERLSAGPLPRGGVTALVGPNGSGKSTLFRCLSGALRPRRGAVRLDGTDLAELTARERARRVFHLAQELGRGANLTVFEVVLLARKSLDSVFAMRAGLCDLRAVQHAIEELGLAPLCDRPLAQLSGGQKQLVGIAQALAREPDVLLLDEPTSALDVRRQLEVMETVGLVTRRRGIVTVAAMHDLALAARFADRLIVLKDGCIAAEGAPDEVIARPALSAAYKVGIHVERSRRGSLLIEPFLPQMRAAE